MEDQEKQQKGNKEEEEQDRDEETAEDISERKKQKKKQKKKESSDDEGEDYDQRNAFLQHLLHSMVMNRNVRSSGSSNQELVQNLKKAGAFCNSRVEEALLQIPRGNFVPKDLQGEAYVDSPLRIATMGFNISAPHMYAVCLENLNIQLGMTFLDVGSGCGHFTTLGGYLVGKKGKAIGLDLRDDIIQFARSNVKTLTEESGIDFSNVEFFVRNCFVPFPDKQQFDRIHVGACCPESQTQNLFKLLAPGGILVTPLGDKLVKVTKDSNENIKIEKILAVAYSDLIVPSEAEIKEALIQIERIKAQTIVVPPSTYATDFIKLFNNPEISDVQLKVEGKSIYCHKVILAARSDHFKAMFFSGLRESKESEIVLPEMQYDIFLDIIKYIYTDESPLRTPDRAIDIVGVANYLKLDRLKAMCELVIKESIEIENAAYILQVASRHEAWQLKRFALDYIMSHYEEVEKTKCFDDLDKPLLIEVTKEACKYLSK